MSVLTTLFQDLAARLCSPEFLLDARHTDHPTAFSCLRKLPLAMPVGAMERTARWSTTCCGLICRPQKNGWNHGGKTQRSGDRVAQGRKVRNYPHRFSVSGKRCRESLRLAHTKTNIAYATRLDGEIVNSIAKYSFRYKDFFPNSRTVKAMQKPPPAPPRKAPPRPTTVGQLLDDYLRIAERNLELSSYNNYQQVAHKHLYPQWKQVPAASVTARDLRTWIMSLTVKSKTI